MIVLRLINKLIGFGLLSKRYAARLLDWLERNTSSKNIQPDKSLPEIYALAIGKKDNKLASVGVTYEGTPTRELSMGDATGLPLALGLKMFLQNEITEIGVIAPESTALNHKKLLLEILNLLGIEDASIKIDRSWD